MKCASHIVIKLICLREMRQLPSKLLEDVYMYFKTIIPHVTFSISVWGRCSPVTFADIDRLHLSD